MESVRLETAKLKDIDERYYYGASCSKCGHSSRLSIIKLKEFLGEEYPIVKIRRRLKCERCGSRECVIAFLAPESMSASLAHMRARHPGT